MASSSNRAKHVRKLKRRATLAVRSAKFYQTQWFNTQCNLVAVLGQLGGETTITQGTYAQAVEGIIKGELSYEAVKGANAQETILRVVTKQAEQTVVPDPIVEAGVEAFDMDIAPPSTWANQDLEGGFDAEGEYHHSEEVIPEGYRSPMHPDSVAAVARQRARIAAIQASNNLLAEEGAPYENIGYNDA